MKIGNFVINKHQALPDFDVPPDINDIYRERLKSGKRLILGTLVARSGTRWLCDIFSAHKNATGVTERNAIPESFMRYVAFNNLPIDSEGLLGLIKKGIVDDWEKNDVSLVFSPYFSHSIKVLVDSLHPEQTIIGLAEPKFTVQSIYNKGVFTEQVFYSDVEKIIGYQPVPDANISHFFGRVIPSGAEYKRWSKLSRVGKITWWGNRIMTDIKTQMDTLPTHKFFIFDLPSADQNYDYYTQMADYFGLEPVLDKQPFLSLKEQTVKETDNLTHKWTDLEETEFRNEAYDWLSIYKDLTPPYEGALPLYQIKT